MLAAYLGQDQNLRWLIENDAKFNLQQTISGRSALFFAIKGLEDKQCSEKACVAVMLALIEKQPNLFIQDKDKNEIFLFSAIKHLSGIAIRPILEALNTRIIKLAEYTNNDDDDIFYCAIKDKRFDTLKILLEYHPDYLEKSIGDFYFYSTEDINNLIKDFSTEEKTELKNIFVSKLDCTIVEEIFNDSKLSNNDYLQKYINIYHSNTIEKDYPTFNLTKGDQVYLSTIGTAILNGKDLSKQELSKNDLAAMNVCALKKKNDLQVEDFDNFDILNNAMLAAYLGQVKNLKWLLENKVRLNRQQTISEQSALFFAIKGLKDKQCSTEDCVAVILTLIKNDAKLDIQDQSSEIFLFSAIKHLSAESISPILKALKAKIEELTQFTNDKKEDIFYYAIKNKRFDTFRILLKYYPDYLEDNIGDNCCYTLQSIQDLIKDFSPKEKLELKNIFLNKLDSALVDKIFSEINGDHESTKDIYPQSNMKKSAKNYKLRQFDQSYNNSNRSDDIDKKDDKNNKESPLKNSQ
jgi:hypothetical protein